MLLAQASARHSSSAGHSFHEWRAKERLPRPPRLTLTLGLLAVQGDDKAVLIPAQGLEQESLKPWLLLSQHPLLASCPAWGPGAMVLATDRLGSCPEGENTRVS